MALLSFIQSIFLEIFTFFYPVLRSHFATYLIFLLILIGLYRALSNITKQYKLSGGKGMKGKFQQYKKPETFAKVMLHLLKFFILIYIVWFIFIHFHTFQILSQGVNNG